jgi:hypothetical protein
MKISRTKSKTILVLEDSKIIFFHNYKVAGTSFRSALSHFVKLDVWLISNLLYFIGVKTKILKYWSFPKHISPLEVLKKLDSSKFDNYNKFGLVRNPWDWEVSKYRYTLKNKNHFQHKLVKNLGSFENYIEWRKTEFRTQLSFFADENMNIIVDHIGKMEDLTSTIDYLKSIGIAADLPHLNVSRKDNYRQYYTDKTRDIVKNLYAEDLKEFGYSF